MTDYFETVICISEENGESRYFLLRYEVFGEFDEEMEGEDAGNAVSIIADERISLFFREFQYSVNQCAKKSEDNECAEETPFLTDGAEDEVGALFRHEIEFCLGSMKVAFAEESARSDGDFRLVEVEVGTERVGGFAQNSVNT